MESMSIKWGLKCELSLLLIMILIFLPLFGCQNHKINTVSLKKTPPNKEERITLAGNRQIPYKLDKEYIYVFKTDKGDVGRGTFKIQKKDYTYDSGEIVTLISSNVDINDKSNDTITKGNSVLTFDRNWYLSGYERRSYGEYKKNPKTNGTEKVILDIRREWFQSLDKYRIFTKLKITDPKEGKTDEFDIELPDGGFIFDNNFLGLMAYICSQPELKAGRTEILKVLSINLHRVITIKMTPKIKVELNYKGKKIISYEVDMKADDATFGRYFITPNGVLLKAEEMSGLMLIELTNPDI